MKYILADWIPDEYYRMAAIAALILVVLFLTCRLMDWLITDNCHHVHNYQKYGLSASEITALQKQCQIDFLAQQAAEVALAQEYDENEKKAEESDKKDAEKDDETEKEKAEESDVNITESDDKDEGKDEKADEQNNNQVEPKIADKQQTQV